MTDEFHDVGVDSTSPVSWNEIVSESIEGWFWATRATHEFRIACLKAAGRFVADLSFVLIRDGRACGLAPLVISRDVQWDDAIASYSEVPLPWPMTVTDDAQRNDVQRALFDELERRVRLAGATLLRLTLAPPGIVPATDAQFTSVVRDRAFVDASYLSHWVEVTRDTLSSVRERYRREVRKYSSAYEMQVISSQNIPAQLAEAYMELHTKDAGRVSRPLETYAKQVDFVRSGEGFWATARSRTHDKIVGMLLINVYKGAAYDSSVAVDPQFQPDCVSHLLKWKAIEHLVDLQIEHYELGIAALTPSYLWQPTRKNYGISFFKEGWSRSRLKAVRVAEKFYTRQAFDRFWNLKGDALREHFSLNSGGDLELRYREHGASEPPL